MPKWSAEILDVLQRRINFDFYVEYVKQYMYRVYSTSIYFGKRAAVLLNIQWQWTNFEKKNIFPFGYDSCNSLQKILQNPDLQNRTRHNRMNWQ